MLKTKEAKSNEINRIAYVAIIWRTYFLLNLRSSFCELNFAHIWAFLHSLCLALNGILCVHHHGDGDEEQGEDGVGGEWDPEQGHAQHRRDHQLERAGEGFQNRV